MFRLGIYEITHFDTDIMYWDYGIQLFFGWVGQVL